MPAQNYFDDYVPHSGSGSTVVHIGPSTTDYTMPAQTAARRVEPSSSDWASYASPSSRPTSRADSAGSNVSLKDTVDVFVDDKFLKSYNLNFEPVRIKIGDDGGQAGSTYASKPLPSGFSQNSGRLGSPSPVFDQPRSSSANTIRSSYHKNVKETHTSTTPGNYAPTSVISVGGQNDYSGTRNSSVQSANYYGTPYPDSREHRVPIRVEGGYSSASTNRGQNESRSASNNTSSRSQGYSIPITREDDRNTAATRTIPVRDDNGGYSIRAAGLFSPDSGRSSIDLPASRAGYVATPLPATPLGRQSDITFSPNGSNISIGSPHPGDKYSNQNYSTNTRKDDTSRRSNRAEYAKQSSQDSSRPSVHFDSSSNSSKPHTATFTRDSEPRSATFSRDSEPRTATFTRDSEPRTATYTRDSNEDSDADFRKTNRTSRSRPDYDHYAPLTRRDDSPSVPVGTQQEFSVSKVNVSGSHSDNQAIVNSPSLTYAMDSRPSTGMSDHYSKSPIPAAPADHMRSSSLNRSTSRGRDRPSSRVGLPTYERDYVDKPGDESDLDNLSDEDRNERLRQKKLIYPQSRNAALVAELKETTSGISASRRDQKEFEFSKRAEKKEFSAMLDRLTTEQFMPQVPYYDEEGLPIAEYKRSFLAKQAANQARRDFQARIENGEEIENIVQSAEWKKLFIDSAKEEYDGTPFKLGVNKDMLQISLNKNKSGNRLQPWQLELKRLNRFND